MIYILSVDFSYYLTITATIKEWGVAPSESSKKK